jgi:HK97 family phage major capsid protein
MKTLQELLARQSEINKRMAEIKAKASDDATSADELKELRAETENLSNERSNIEARIVILRSEISDPVKPLSAPAPVINNTVQQREEMQEVTSVGRYGSLAYRQAFMNFVTKREESPVLRAETSTTTGNIGSVIIPTTITDRIFKKNEYAGSIFARVTKTSYPAGMAIPTSNFHPKLEWVAENSTATKTGATTGTIVFAGYKGQIRVAISLEAQTMSLEQFEAGLVEKILEACSEGFDEAIVAGDGNKKPTGILTNADYEKKAVLMTAKEIEDYSYWITVFSKLPLKKQTKASLHINKADWQAHILGMKDSTNKVIALETMGFGGNIVPTFMGKEVVFLEDQGLPLFDSLTGSATASKATAFAYFFDDSDYIFNSNMQLTLREYVDEDTDEKIHKATIICDGKVVDDDSLLIVCRDAD